MTRRGDERGFTLTELSVVMMIGSIVMFITLNFLDNTSLVVGRATSSVRTEADARLALRTTLQDIRAAEEISQTYPATSTCPSATTYPAGYSSCLRFKVPHTVSSTATCSYSLMTYGVVSGVLKADRVDYDATCNAKTIYTGKPVLKNITNGSSRPVFRYYDRYGNALSTSSGTTAAFADAGTVNVQIYFQPQPRSAELSLFSAAALRNNR